MKKNLIPSCLSSDVKTSVGHMRPCYSPTLVLSRALLRLRHVSCSSKGQPQNTFASQKFLYLLKHPSWKC